MLQIVEHLRRRNLFLRNPSIPFATVEKLYEEGCFSKVRQWKQKMPFKPTLCQRITGGISR